MHWLDITILVVLGIGAVFGFWSGLLWQIARVLGLIFSLYLAIAINTPVSEWLGQQWQDTSAAICRVAAFVLIFLSVYLTLYLATCLIHKAIKETKLEMVDRMLGAILGMAKMGVVVSGICAGLTVLALPMTQAWLEQSTLAPHFARGTDVAIRLIPQHYRDRVDDNVQQARDQFQKKVTEAAVDTLKDTAVKTLER
jgi:uncharacterized membrane protein required for colicin V production